MLRERVYQGVWAGLVAAAALAGVLMGFGRAHGAIFQPLNSIAHVAYGTRALLLDEFRAAITLTGVLILIVAMVIWGIVLAIPAGRLRGIPLFGAALVVAAVSFLCNHFILPSRVAPGLDQLLTHGEMVALYLVMAIALAIGTGLAAPHAPSPPPLPESNDSKSGATADVAKP
ncbi:MAG: hypothetical protein ACREOJ_03300 [Gemmatimonadaceae bacterium]